MTWNYSAIVPVILTATVAYALRQWLSPPSVYTLKLLRRGDLVPQGLQAWIIGARRAQDVMSKDFGVATAPPATPMAGATVLASRTGSIREVFLAGSRVSYVTVEPEDHLLGVLRTMEDGGAPIALVCAPGSGGAPGDVLGVIGDRELATLSRASARLME
jgi:CIC family chloride channel protein